MLTRLKEGKKVVGTKQSMRAVRAGQAAVVFLALDADPMQTDPIRVLCVQMGVELVEVPTMELIGRACGVKGAALAAVLA